MAKIPIRTIIYHSEGQGIASYLPTQITFLRQEANALIVRTYTIHGDADLKRLQRVESNPQAVIRWPYHDEEMDFLLKFEYFQRHREELLKENRTWQL